MCGICGYFAADEKPIHDLTRLKAMTCSLAHRGPDGESFYELPYLGIGFRRLSIIDLETGLPPIFNEDRTKVAFLNGEIYNYRELRDDLIKKGHRFRTRSDTEVIVHLYEQLGVRAFEKLNGMFAIVLWDLTTRHLYLCRDRLGVKPLYVSSLNKVLIFGSEIKAILSSNLLGRDFDRESLYRYLTLNYIPGQQTLFKGITKLEPGTFLTASESGITSHRYWSPPTDNDPELTYADFESTYENLFSDATSIRLRSDVPIGVFLSGGIDSSAVAYHLNRLGETLPVAFTARFNNSGFDESPYAALVAKKFNFAHRLSTFDYLSIPDLVNKATAHNDSCLGDSSTIPTYLISQHAAQHVKVALSGDGGDELFSGYETYVASVLARPLGTIPFSLSRSFLLLAGLLPINHSKKSLEYRIKRFLRGIELPPSLRHSFWNGMFDHNQICKLMGATSELETYRENLRNYFNAIFLRFRGDFVSRLSYFDLHTYLVDDILLKVDQMSMANSLEVRSPFLDYRLVEMALRTPGRLKLRWLKKKYLLKRYYSGKIPNPILNRRKEGFSVPLASWFQKPLREMLFANLNHSRPAKAGILNQNAVEQFANRWFANKTSDDHQLWNLFNFHLWYDNFFLEKHP